jgi:ABC-type multidrug transport system permease subunit
MMALMKTIELFAKEKPVVQREQQRKQYSSLEYLLAKAIAEIPLDTVFAAIFTTTLKSLCGIRIGWRALTGTFTLMTVSGASLGFAIGALVSSRNKRTLSNQTTSQAFLFYAFRRARQERSP